MPNWCLNRLEISADAETLNLIEDSVSGVDAETGDHILFSLNSIIAQPDDIGDQWREWAMAKWGTKWDVDCDQEEWEKSSPEESMISITFLTAWSPPIQAICLLAEKFQTAAFALKYMELGVGFVGESQFENGDLSGSFESDDNEKVLYYGEKWFDIVPDEEDRDP